MVRSIAISFCVLVVGASLALSQQRVEPRNLHERILCIVPIVGTGSVADPRRPMYAPAVPRAASPQADAAIIAYASVVSDDGRFALVEFVARDRSAFAAILADTRPDLKVFEKGKVAPEVIEREFRKHKKNFSLDQFEVNVP